jgi:hypothetical protein
MTLAFWMFSLYVRFTVVCVFNVIFSVEKLKNKIKNAFDGETHIQTAHPKRKCVRILS